VLNPASPLKVAFLCSAALLLTTGAAPPRQAHDFFEVAISPDGQHIASIEGDETESGKPVIKSVVIRDEDGKSMKEVALPCGRVAECTPSDLAWAPDARQLSFILRSPGSHAHDIYTVAADASGLSKTLAFDGTLVSPRYAPNGELAVLATPGAAKEAGALVAGAPLTGELGADIHEQRIAIVAAGKIKFASPPDLFVYEYDWRPDALGFVGTAAHGDGDNMWWVAELYAFDAADGSGHILYSPSSPKQQIANPIISPDGKSVAFIGGLMSDFGSTGGDAFILRFGHSQKPLDITANMHASVTAIAWPCNSDGLLARLLVSDKTEIAPLDLSPTPELPAPIAAGEEIFGGSNGPVSFSCSTKATAVVHQSFTAPAEIEVGEIGHWHDITHTNGGLKPAARVQNVTWKNGGFDEQGWLLLPAGATSPAKLPMITIVHGGPAAANEPHFLSARLAGFAGLTAKLLDQDYAVFLPNPRGSYGEGEAYTQANVRDFGHGDLTDILAGIDEVGRVGAIDEARLGIMGWSYGGYMTMWTVTQTNRFKAAVAGAGISDWLSYYGENGIDEWMIPYFGASVYDDPAIYAHSSPITYIKQVHTPTLEVVGENDIECPAPQTMEFWHALNTLGVPTQSVIYPGEGHGMRSDPKHWADFESRTIGWFDKYLK
jgi:dipeptidyl aminopeptidase/acylaminoacyl peptidase